MAASMSSSVRRPLPLRPSRVAPSRSESESNMRLQGRPWQRPGAEHAPGVLTAPARLRYDLCRPRAPGLVSNTASAAVGASAQSRHARHGRRDRHLAQQRQITPGRGLTTARPTTTVCRRAGTPRDAGVTSARRVSVAREQGARERLGVERAEVLEPLAHPDQLHRDRPARARSPARCRPWPCRPAWSARSRSRPRPRENSRACCSAVLPGRGVDREQHLVRRPRHRAGRSPGGSSRSSSIR